MRKVCKNCGSIAEEEARFCTRCGSSDFDVFFNKDETPQFAQANEMPQYSLNKDIPNFTPINDDPRKNNKKKLFIILGSSIGAAVILVAVILILVNIFGGYKSAIDNFIDVNLRGQYNKAEKLAPKEFWDWYEEKNNVDIDDVQDYYEERWEDLSESFEDKFGENWKVSYTVDKEKEITGKKLEKIADAFEDTYDIDAKEIKKAYDLKGEIVFEGPDDFEDEDVEISVVQIGGSWYLFRYYSKINGGYSVNIITRW